MTRVEVPSDITCLCVNTIKMLAVDAVEEAGSGHPGAPMGCADIAFVLWTQYLRFCPDTPRWPGRDRFVLSNGHGSMLLYSLLHLFGYDLSIDDLQNFRQWGSRAAGHPEFGLTPGVEVTTGPLGQGFAHAVGMAIAAKMQASSRHVPEPPYIYGICSDGDLMEGVSYEAASLAGHLRLGNLIFFYDDNRITIDGSTDLAFSEDIRLRFEACHWHVVHIDGHDHNQISKAIELSQAERERPSLIIAHTIIGHGSPNKAGKPECHGNPLGQDEVRRTKEALGWPHEPTFHVPDEVRTFFAAARAKKIAQYHMWEETFVNRDGNTETAGVQDPSSAVDLLLTLAVAVQNKVAPLPQMSQAVLNKAAELFPNLVGGAADLQTATGSRLEGGGIFGRSGQGGKDEFSPVGRNIYFGVREHAMGSIINGISLFGGFRSFGATYLPFSDYMRPAIRLAAMMRINPVFIFTHDSIFIGENGPTHQPVEQLWSLRSIPNVTLFRPADGIEVAAAWAYALSVEDTPTLLVLARQELPPLVRPASFQGKDVLNGGYVVAETPGAPPSVTIVATGSEVSLATQVAEALNNMDISTRVVSMPCIELFKKQPKSYREHVLGSATARIVVLEAGSTTGWYELTGHSGLAIGVDQFGKSAPALVIAQKYGFTVQTVLKRIVQFLAG